MQPQKHLCVSRHNVSLCQPEEMKVCSLSRSYITPHQQSPSPSCCQLTPPLSSFVVLLFCRRSLCIFLTLTVIPILLLLFPIIVPYHCSLDPLIHVFYLFLHVSMKQQVSLSPHYHIWISLCTHTHTHHLYKENTTPFPPLICLLNFLFFSLFFVQ